MQQLASLKGSRLLTPPSQQQQAGDAADQAAPTSQMYAIYDGRKPTGGYQLTFSQVKEMDTWEMHFTLIQPEPGSVVTQAMTQPCSVIMVTGQTDKALSFWLDGKRLK